MIWRKSSYSSNGGATCVEVACTRRRGVAVRDSKNPAGGAVTLDGSAWRTLLAAVKRGQYDM
jgi:hypothetical protein